MDPKLHTLPPMKRFRLLHQDNHHHHHNHHSEPEPKPISKPSPISPSHLPAKKRKQSRFPPNSDENLPPPPPPRSITLPTPFNLPAKKRVWAFKPEVSPNTTPSPEPICLPAKKRVWAFQPEISPTPSPICLPAKKRIWAFKPEPEISPSKTPLKEIDLNVEYTPSPEKKKEVQIDGESEGGEEDENEREEEAEEEEDEEEEDGILCAVCESTDGDPTDPIVFCDGCDLMVHATCYGNPLIKGIPEGDWFCSQCLNTRHSAHKETTEQEKQRCCLCPVIGGATKPTNDGRWAHIVCAVLVPEVFFEEPEGRDGIDCSKVPKRRWKESCYLCKKTRGCAIECSEPKCPMSFHVTCGLKEDLCIELKQGRCSTNGGIVAAFCRKHTEIWKRQQQTGKFKIVARD